MEKVLLLHNIISPHTERVFQELAKLALLEVVYCAQSESNRNWKTNPHNYSYSILNSIKVEFSGKDLFTLIFNPMVIEKIKSHNPDLVIISGWDLPTYWVAAFYCWLKSIPYVIWSGSTENEKSWRRTISRPLVKLILSKASKYLVYGLKARDYLISLGVNSRKINIVYNSIDTDFFSKPGDQKLKEKLNSQYNLKNKTVILFYGQLIERKNPELLIRSFNAIKADNTALLIVGSGIQQAYLENLIKSKKMPNIHIISDPGDKKMLAFYDSADIFVLPSKEEVWGLVVNQAMCKNLPVIISSAVGCTRDLVIDNKTGFIFNSGNQKQLEEALKVLIGNKELREVIGKNARERVKITAPYKVAEKIYEAISSKMPTEQNYYSKLVKLPTITDDCNLTFIQNSDLPFKIKRFYYIYDSIPNYPRGFHAHKKNKQLLIPIKGSVTMVMDDGSKKETVKLDKPNEGIFIDKMIWHEMHDIKKETIMLVLASDEYDPNDYIRDYDTFLERLKNES